MTIITKPLDVKGEKDEKVGIYPMIQNFIKYATWFLGLFERFWGAA